MTSYDSAAFAASYASALARRYRGIRPPTIAVHENFVAGARCPHGRKLEMTIAFGEWSDRVLEHYGLITREHVRQLVQRMTLGADGTWISGVLRWTDEGGTRWILRSRDMAALSGGEFLADLMAELDLDYSRDPDGVLTKRHTKAVERMLRQATGRKVRFHDVRAIAAGAA